MLNYESFSQYFTAQLNRSWFTLVKIGFSFIGVGLLIILLQELIIGILSALIIGIGIYILFIAFRIWKNVR